jgi:hypothetical protein
MYAVLSSPSVLADMLREIPANAQALEICDKPIP